eukprot:scaffold36901_cov24-Tisochrysis_lutea.AAC.2
MPVDLLGDAPPRLCLPASKAQLDENIRAFKLCVRKGLERAVPDCFRRLLASGEEPLQEVCLALHHHR